MSDAVIYRDLGATVYRACLPEGLAREVDDLYGNYFSTLDYIAVYDELTSTGAVVLERPATCCSSPTRSAPSRC